MTKEENKKAHKAEHVAITDRTIEELRSATDLQPSTLRDILERAENDHRELDFGWLRSAFKACPSGSIECSKCDKVVLPEDPYYATPCGTYCSVCMHEHAKKCEICRKEFDLK